MVFDCGEEAVEGDRLGTKRAIAVLVGQLLARDVNAKGVAILAVEESDNGLIVTTSRQGIPLDGASTSYAEAELLSAGGVGVEENNFGCVAQTNGLIQETDQVGRGRG